MEIVMIKKQGCMPCKMFRPTIEKYALDNGIEFRTIQTEDGGNFPYTIADTNAATSAERTVDSQ